MFDNLRDYPDEPLYEDNEPNDPFNQAETTFENVVPETESVASAPARRRRKSRNFLGMTPMQRFIIAAILMFVVCLMGTMTMVILGRMSLFGI